MIIHFFKRVFKNDEKLNADGAFSSIMIRGSRGTQFVNKKPRMSCISSIVIRALMVVWTLCSCNADFNLSVSWDDSDTVNNGISTFTDKTSFRYKVCRETICMHGVVIKQSTDLLDLEICGLDDWGKAWESKSDLDPWPEGIWIVFRRDDTTSYEVFVPWRGLNADCIQSNGVQTVTTQIHVIQLLVADENGDLRGIATEERHILIDHPGIRLNEDDSSTPSSDHIESESIYSGGFSNLTRANFCDLLQHPLILKNSKKSQRDRAIAKEARAQAEISQPDTLILYSFSHSDGWREDNLLFWIARGLIPSRSRYYFVLIFNGDVDPSWRTMLDRVAGRLAGSFEWLARPDRGRDICAWHSVLAGELRIRPGLAGFRRFVLLNGSVRGPFMSASTAGPWPEVFLAPLDSGDVDLSGVTINCKCRAASVDPSRLRDQDVASTYAACDSLADLHVQSYLLAFGRPALAYALRLQEEVCAGVRSDDPPNVQAGKVMDFELRFTQAVLVDGGNLAVTQHLWQVLLLKDGACILNTKELGKRGTLLGWDIDRWR
jgi:hypothetical protein